MSLPGMEDPVLWIGTRHTVSSACRLADVSCLIDESLRLHIGQNKG